MNADFLKRLKSFAWRAGVVALLAGINYVSQSLVNLSLPDWAVVLIGLVANEATKWLNNNTALFGARLK